MFINTGIITWCKPSCDTLRYNSFPVVPCPFNQSFSKLPHQSSRPRVLFSETLPALLLHVHLLHTYRVILTRRYAKRYIKLVLKMLRILSQIWTPSIHYSWVECSTQRRDNTYFQKKSGSVLAILRSTSKTKFD